MGGADLLFLTGTSLAILPPGERLAALSFVADPQDGTVRCEGKRMYGGIAKLQVGPAITGGNIPDLDAASEPARGKDCAVG